MGIQLAPIEGTPYAGGTATGVIYLDANGLQRTDGSTIDASGNLTVGGDIQGPGTGRLALGNKANGYVEVTESVDNTGIRFGQGGSSKILLRSSELRASVDGAMDLGGIGHRWQNVWTGILNAVAPAITDTPLVVNGAVGQTADLATIGDVTIDAASNVATDGDITANGNLTLPSPTVPASSSATGVAGTVSWDADYIYVCTATDTWKRVAIATW